MVEGSHCRDAHVAKEKTTRLFFMFQAGDFTEHAFNSCPMSLFFGTRLELTTVSIIWDDMVVSSIPVGENSRLSPLSVIPEYCLLTAHFGFTIMTLKGRVEYEVKGQCQHALFTHRCLHWQKWLCIILLQFEISLAELDHSTYCDLKDCPKWKCKYVSWLWSAVDSLLTNTSIRRTPL